MMVTAKKKVIFECPICSSRTQEVRVNEEGIRYFVCSNCSALKRKVANVG